MIACALRQAGRKRHATSRLTPNSRPFKRLRRGHLGDKPLACLDVSPRNSNKNADLKTIAACLAGHSIARANFITRAMWRLAPRPWAYVATRVDQFEEGWRRRRGL